MSLLLERVLCCSALLLFAGLGRAASSNTPAPISLQTSQFWYVSRSSYPLIRRL